MGRQFSHFRIATFSKCCDSEARQGENMLSSSSIGLLVHNISETSRSVSKITRKISKLSKSGGLNEISDILRFDGPRSDTTASIGKTTSENSCKNLRVIQRLDQKCYHFDSLF